MSVFGRREYQPTGRLGPGLAGLLLANLAVFVLGALPAGHGFVVNWLTLDAYAFRPWQALTYMFVHFQLWHFLGNMLGLFFFGPYVEEAMGTRRFLGFYLACGAAGAIVAYALAPFIAVGYVLGASGALYGVLFACHHFHPDMVVYLFAVLPMRLKHLLVAYGVLDFLFMLTGEPGVAWFAHLGGLAAGAAILRLPNPFPAALSRLRARRERHRIADEETVRAEVDRILAKISAEGMAALSGKEKKILSRASRLYARSTASRAS